LDWEKICPKNKGDEIYILGNPPYLGYSVQKVEHKNDMNLVFNSYIDYKSLDYIACWMVKGAEFITKFNSRYAFVSTNSICQGEQVSLLWPKIFENKLEIGFAYQTFKWVNNAKSNAGVSCIIVGVRNISIDTKYLFSNSLSQKCHNISPYLTNSNTVFIKNRNIPLSSISKIGYGSSALDGGFLLFSNEERNKAINDYPIIEKFFKKIIGSQELIKGFDRWCLWIEDNELEEAMSIKLISDRLEKVQQFRLQSNRQATIETSKTPHKFGESRYKQGNLIVIPKVSSENREYLPIGFFSKNIVVMDKAFPIYNPDIFLFSILCSKFHLVWLNAVGGKLESRLSYSSSIVYNTFPFPPITDIQKQELTQCTFRILEEREKHSEKTLAQLYDPDKMPEGLREAHRLNDLAVERCYRNKPFENDEERLEYLFKLYEQMIEEERNRGTLFAGEKKKKSKAKKK